MHAGVDPTFILPNVFQSKGQACILSFHDPHLAKRTLAHDPQQTEVIEVDCCFRDSRSAIALAHGTLRERA